MQLVLLAIALTLPALAHAQNRSGAALPDGDAIAAAAEWYERMISASVEAGGPLQATVLAEKHVKACAPFRQSSQITTKKQVARLNACFVAAHKLANHRIAAKPQWSIAPTLSGILVHMSTARSKNKRDQFVRHVEATTKDTTIVQLHMDHHLVAEVTVFFAVTAEGTVKAVWMTEQPFELYAE